MKKVVILFLTLLGIMAPVKAANYEIRELIPEGVQTTIRGETFLYKNFIYQEGVIKF